MHQSPQKIGKNHTVYSQQEVQAEDWKFIEGFDGLYKISRSGEVISKKFERETGALCWMLKKTRIGKIGYPVVRLECARKGKKGQEYYIHRLLGTAFVENPHEKAQINHKNGIKTDNRLENLEWVTPKENIRHAFKTGLSRQIGETCYQAKLSEQDVLATPYSSANCFWVTPPALYFARIARTSCSESFAW